MIKVNYLRKLFNVQNFLINSEIADKKCDFGKDKEIDKSFIGKIKNRSEND